MRCEHPFDCQILVCNEKRAFLGCNLADDCKTCLLQLICGRTGGMFKIAPKIFSIRCDTTKQSAAQNEREAEDEFRFHCLAFSKIKSDVVRELVHSTVKFFVKTRKPVMSKC